MQEEKDIFDYLKKGNIETPDTAYFEQLSNNIIADQTVTVIPLYKRRVVWLGAVAAALVIAFLTIDFSGPENENDVLLALNDLSTEEVLSYVDTHIEEFDTELLSEIIPDSEINPFEPSTPELSPQEIPLEENVVIPDNIDTEEILDYINSEEIDIYDLEDELFL